MSVIRTRVFKPHILGVVFKVLNSVSNWVFNNVFCYFHWTFKIWMNSDKRKLPWETLPWASATGCGPGESITRDGRVSSIDKELPCMIGTRKQVEGYVWRRRVTRITHFKKEERVFFTLMKCHIFSYSPSPSFSSFISFARLFFLFFLFFFCFLSFFFYFLSLFLSFPFLPFFHMFLFRFLPFNFLSFFIFFLFLFLFIS